LFNDAYESYGKISAVLSQSPGWRSALRAAAVKPAVVLHAE
jgi:hypothetical protein